MRENQMLIPATNKMLPILFTYLISWLKPIVLALIGWISGWLVSVTVTAMQIAPANAVSHWYEQPVVAAGFVSGIVTILAIFINNWNEKRKLAASREDEQEKNHVHFSERLQELTNKEREQLLGGLKDLHEREIQFWKTQLQIEEISNFEARQRSHRYGNEVNRLHIYIHLCHIEMANNKVAIPEYKQKSYDELMNGLEEETEKFKQSIVQKLERVINPEKEN